MRYTGVGAIILILAVLLLCPVEAKTVAFRIEPQDPHWVGVSDPAHLLKDYGDRYVVEVSDSGKYPRPVIFLHLPEVKDVNGNFTFKWARMVSFYAYGAVVVYASNDSVHWVKLWEPGCSVGYGVTETVKIKIPAGYTHLRIQWIHGGATGEKVMLWKNASIETPEKPNILPGIPGFEVVLAIVGLLSAVFLLRIPSRR